MSQPISETPRTDAESFYRNGLEVVTAYFARTLEKELNAANKEIERLKSEFQSHCDHEWTTHDDSFDHEFGTERIPLYDVCEYCELHRPTPPKEDYD